MILGAHESIAGGPANAYGRAEADGAESLQVFTKNARGWKARPLEPEECARFRAEARRTGIVAIAHCSYLVNLAAEDPAVRARSIEGFTDELLRCELLGIGDLVVHPGAHPDERRGIELIAQALDECLEAAGGARTRVLLEVTAGQGSSIGHRFEQLADILARVRRPERVAVCLDSCHLFAAGYDLATPKGYQHTMRQLEETLGADRVKAFHLNDCKKPLGSRVDRHAEIGEGELGLEAFRRLVSDERFASIPGVLETPEPARFRAHLELLRSLGSGKKAKPRRQRVS
jgi:deoxyribonuclease-4